MNQLDLVNKMLLRLRENSVSTVSETDYAQLLGQFVNDAKADMEDLNHTWSAYETEIDISILNDGTRTYDLAATNDRSFLIRDSEEDRLPAAYDITSGEVGQLFDAPLKDIRKHRALTNTINDVEIPKLFAIQADTDAGDGWKIHLLWGSNTARSWRMYWYVPQDDLELDGTDNSTEILLPSRPVELRAMFYALNERGEEMGTPGGIAFARSKDSISAALETDMQVQKKSDEIDITNKESL